MNLVKRVVGREVGFGVFALRPFSPGEVVLKDRGRVIGARSYLSMPVASRRISYQVGKYKLLVPRDVRKPDLEWFVNHSCDPNTVPGPNRSWVARRRIAEGEQVTHDYAMIWLDDVEPFSIDPCLCGSKHCRGAITGDNWKRPELQKRYEGFWPGFIRERIAMAHA